MWTDHESTIDYLNCAEDAKRLASVLMDKRAYPLSLGIVGGWGSGKSTMLRLIETQLDLASGTSDFLLVWFDAWRVEGYDEVRAALLETIAKCLEELGEAAENREKVSLLSRVNMLRAFTIMTGLGAAVSGFPVLAAGGLSNVFGGIGTVASNIEGLFSKSGQSGASSLYEISRGIEKKLVEANKYLLIFVDNIDRCSPHNAIHVLEVMRNVLFLPRTAFVFALDDNVLKAAVKKHYEIDNPETVNDYIDKFLQVSFRLRPLYATTIRQYMVGLFLERTGSADLRTEPIVHFVNSLTKAGLSDEQIVDRTRKQFRLTTERVAELRQFIELAQMFASAPGINGNPRTIKRVLNTAELMSRTDVTRDQPEMFRALIKSIVFKRSVSHAGGAALDAMLSGAEPDAHEKLRRLEVEASAGNFSKADLPYEWQSIDGRFLERWLKLKPHLSPLAGSYAISAVMQTNDASYDSQVRTVLQELSNALDSVEAARRPSTGAVLHQYSDELLESAVSLAIRSLNDSEKSGFGDRLLFVLTAVGIHGAASRATAVAFLRSPNGARILARYSLSDTDLGIS